MTTNPTTADKILAVKKIRDKTRNFRIENVASLRSFLWGLPGGMEIKQLLRVDFLGKNVEIRPETLVKTGNRLSMTLNSNSLKEAKEQNVKRKAEKDCVVDNRGY